MKHSCFDLPGLAHIPEVLSKITAGSSGYVHLVVILVATLWTFPLAFVVDDDLTVVSAYMAVIRLCVELCLLDVVVDISDNLSQSIQIVAHVRYLDV